MSAPASELAGGTRKGVLSSLDGGSSPSPVKRVVAALRSTPSVVVSFGWIVFIVLLALAAPLLEQITGMSPYAYHENAIDPALGGLPIGPWGGVSAEHWFGVEPGSGRDIFMRIAYGAQVSLTIAVSATIVTTTLGVVFGMLGGFFGGVLDQLISRLMDFLMAFPALIFMIALLSALPAGNRPLLLVIVLSIFAWPYTARVIRGQTMSLRNGEFVESARASGASPARIAFKEILPNLRGTIIVLSTLSVPQYIGTEAALSFLGVGVTPPTPSWGQMIASSVSWYAVDPMYFVIPGLFLFFTVLSFTVVGDHLQRQLDEGDAA
ncbi:ABC transporter permease [Paramicrobacterium agarici]|uniref:Peptide/nickel transport system permease protein n=1 Tax=Paramicrobacterium agarici TaxID=630514 RepID=A0A2A9DVJ4_9MICO|nr:ABC transporter permease [Microbacterium agarici]PFG30012.1 peptide/nickel transport system permease protein [Microbacterium agarici]TQO23021.1 peptide/nickel transport system permease protein [Microbacterium agarici]